MSEFLNHNPSTQLEAEEWIETVVNGIALFEGVPVHIEHHAAAFGQEGPGDKDAPQQPEPEIPAPMPGEVPSPHPSQPEIVLPHETPAMDPMTPSAPEA